MSDEELPKITCVLIGDDGIGKTSLLISYVTNVFPAEYVPTVGDDGVGKTSILISNLTNVFLTEYVSMVFDNYDQRIVIDDQPQSLYLCDTIGNSDFDRLRPLVYYHADVILICFSVVSPGSIVNLFQKWKSEIAQYCSGVPFVLVGTQIDLRDNTEVIEKLVQNKQTPITTFDGEVFARELMAMSYMECSALSKKGVHKVFEEAIFAALQFPKTKQSSCVLM